MADVPDDASPELLTVAKRVAVAVAQICAAIRPDDAEVALSVCLRFDDFRVFRAVVEVVFGFGMEMVGKIWKLIIKKQDIVFVDELAGWLFKTWRAADDNFEVLMKIPGVTSELIEILRMRVGSAETDRSKRRHFRLLMTQSNSCS
jgi:hypothetical protein